MSNSVLDDLSTYCRNVNFNSGQNFITALDGRWNHRQIAASSHQDKISTETSNGNMMQQPTTSSTGDRSKADGAHKCDRCEKVFAVPASLTRHYRMHTGDRPFVCEVCKKNFTVNENLSIHRQIHTKKMPYRCPHCDRSFENDEKLQRHIRTHTGNKRPHQCIDCEKSFNQSGQLIVHMRTHTGEKPYVCEVCTKRFACSKQLKVHSRTHTGERPFACDVCGKTFAYKHVLKLHKMIHLSERLYKCTLCAETYSSKKTFDVHIKSHGMSAILQPTGSAVVLSSGITPTSSVTSNPCRIGNGIVNSLSNCSNLSFQNSDITDVRTHRQQLLPGSSSGSNFLGRSVAVNPANINSANRFMSSDCQSKSHHRGYNLTYFRPIPPLVPIISDQSMTTTISNLIYSRHYGAEHLILNSSAQKFDEELEVIEVYGQRRMSSGEKMMDQQVLRSTSVIRFSNRPTGGSSS